MKVTKNQIKQAVLVLGTTLFETAEMLKAYIVLNNIPTSIEDDLEILELKKRVKKRLDTISRFQKQGRLLSGFADPPNVNEKAAFVYLKNKLSKLPNIRYIVDIGCFSGWLGRTLSREGYRVHGIDLDDGTLSLAQYKAAGLRGVSFENLTVEDLGYSHPKEYDGAVAFDVLEHLFDTQLGIDSLEQSIKPSGWVFINLPMIDENNELDMPAIDDRYREHIHTFTDTRVHELFGSKKNVSIEVIRGENGVNNWFISYQV